MISNRFMRKGKNFFFVASCRQIVADMEFPPFVADHGCVSSLPPNMMTFLINDEDPWCLMNSK